MQHYSKKKSYHHALELLTGLTKGKVDTESLDAFMGFGQFPELLLPIDDLTEWSEENQKHREVIGQLHNLVRTVFQDDYDRAISSLKNSGLSSYFTPDWLIVTIVNALATKLRDRIIHILEPAAGTGKFIPYLMKEFPDAKITAVEKDLVTGKILTAAFPDANVIVDPLETCPVQQADLVISNIPFGAYRVYDPEIISERNAAKIRALERIHTYFFVKGLDHLNAGGFLVFLVTNAMMDSPGNRQTREYLMFHSDLVCAIRLPDSVFETAGTQPTVDIIVLRKSAAKKKKLSVEELTFVESDHIETKDPVGVTHTLDVNLFFKNNPTFVLGEFVAEDQYERGSLSVKLAAGTSVPDLSSTISNLITAALAGMEEFDVRAKKEAKDISPKKAKKLCIIPDNYPSLDTLADGNLIFFKNEVGHISTLGRKKVFEKVNLPVSKMQLTDFIHLRNGMVRLIASEISQATDVMEKYRFELNNLYNRYTSRYGALNTESNKNLLAYDSDGFKLLTLEKIQEAGIAKADIFEKQITNAPKDHSKATTLQEALLVSLNEKNGINLSLIAGLLGQGEDRVLQQGITEGLFFRNLSVENENSLLTRDQFISGKVVDRLEQWQALKEQEDHGDALYEESEIENNIKLLREVQPAYLAIDLIDLSLGERWVPLEVYERFTADLFKVPTQVTYLSTTDTYYVQTMRHSDEDTITYAASTGEGMVHGARIVEYALSDVRPSLTIKNLDTKKRVPDLLGMKNVEMKMKEVKDQFIAFYKNDPELTANLEKLYNRRFNSTVKREYDGSHLKVPGLQHFTPYASQLDAVWMLLQNHGGVVDQKVGAGKTLIMIITAMEMKRLGLSRKTLILCMKTNVAEVAANFKQAYPNAKILAPDPLKDFKPERRRQIFASIALNDWDAVVLTHEQFMKIPQDHNTMQEVLNAELNDIEENLDLVKSHHGLSNRARKGLERRKENLKARLLKIQNEIDRDANLWHFGNMGFDQMLVDESHTYKNLPFTTYHQNVSGLGSPEGSKRGLNMLWAVRTLQNKLGADKGVTFLSGTTLSNSLVELYLIFKYLRPRALAELSISTFDGWASIFARKSTTFEFTVTNQVKPKERFREFVKVPELSRFYAEVTHFVGNHNFKQDKPALKNIVVSIEPTEPQKQYIKKLITFSQTKDPSHVDLRFNADQMNAYMLIATNLAKKMSLDMRLINSRKYGFEPGCKIDILCQKLYAEYTDSTSYKGVQLVFCDHGTPTTKGFNVYADIKERLVRDYGIPAEEIQFIHNFITKAKKKEFISKVNAGEIRVAIGGTKNLGTGLNIQRRIIAIHHIDIPWTPMAIEQRNGRASRPLNWAAKEFRNNEVNNYFYAVNQTLDAYQFNLLATKQQFIHQIKLGSIDQRRIDEGAFDPEGGMNFAEYVAILSGNTDLLEKVKLEKRLADLERGLWAFQKRKAEAQHSINYNEIEVRQKQKTLVRLHQDLKNLEATDAENELITIGNTTTNDKKEAGSWILHKVTNVVQSLRPGTTELLLSVSKFKLYGKVKINLFENSKSVSVFVTGESGQEYYYAGGQLNQNPALAGRYIIDSIKRIPKLIEDTQQEIKSIESRNEAYNRIIQGTYNDMSLILELKDRIEALNHSIEQQFSQGENQSEDIAQPIEADLEADLG